MEENQNIYPELLKEALLEIEVPEEEMQATIEMLSFALIAHL